MAATTCELHGCNNIIIIFNISIALFTIEDQKRFTKKYIY